MFTKPWREPGLEALADQVAEMGFDGVELAVRPGYQVEPETALKGLSEAVRIFRDRGLVIDSVATEMSGRMVAACGAAGVPILRTMLPVDTGIGYVESVRRFQKEALALIHEMEATGVRIGVQNHCDNFVGTASGLMAALDPLPESFVAVVDLGHTALCGEPVSQALEIAESRLAMVNLKNAVRIEGPVNSYGELTWKHRWVSAKNGLTSWSEAAVAFRRMKFAVPVCLTAEYHDETGSSLTGEAAAMLARNDLEHLKDLLSNV